MLGDELSELLDKADRISHLSTLTLIYRSIPASPYSSSAFCEDCIATAHQTLDEHQICLVMLRNMEDNFVEFYLQWYDVPFCQHSLESR